MAKQTSIKTRNKLEDMCRQERSDAKCVLTKRLHNEAAELTNAVDAEIKICELEITEIKERMGVSVVKRDKMLKDAKLYGVVNDIRFKDSWCALEDDHPDRVEFDAETNRLLKNILTMD